MATRPFETSFGTTTINRWNSEWLVGGDKYISAITDDIVYDPNLDGSFGTTSATGGAVIFSGFDKNDVGTTTVSGNTFRRNAFCVLGDYETSLNNTTTIKGTFKFPETGSGSTDAASHSVGICANIQARDSVGGFGVSAIADDNSGPGAYFDRMTGGYLVWVESDGGLIVYRITHTAGARYGIYETVSSGHTVSLTAGTNFTVEVAVPPSASAVTLLVKVDDSTVVTATDSAANRTATGSVGFSLNRQDHTSVTNAPRCSQVEVTDANISTSGAFLVEDWARPDATLVGTHTPPAGTTNVADTLTAVTKVWEWGSQHRVDFGGGLKNPGRGNGLTWMPWNNDTAGFLSLADLWQNEPTNADYQATVEMTPTLGTGGAQQQIVQLGFGVIVRGSKSATDAGSPSLSNFSGYVLAVYFQSPSMVFSLVRYNSGTGTVLVAPTSLPVPFGVDTLARLRLMVDDNSTPNPELSGWMFDATGGEWVSLFSAFEDTSGSKIAAKGMAGYYVTFNKDLASAMKKNYGFRVNRFVIDNDTGGGGGGGGGVGTWSLPNEPPSVGTLSLMPEAPDTRTPIWNTSQIKTDRGYFTSRATMSISRDAMSATWVLDATDFATVNALLNLALSSGGSFGIDLDADSSLQYFILTDGNVPVTRIAPDAFRIGPVNLLEVFPS